MVCIGVDLHRKRSQLAALDADGAQLFSRSIPTQPHESPRVFGELAPEPIEVAFEATVGWGWFADLLADVGVPAHMAHPLATRAIATARVKNDAIDARPLALVPNQVVDGLRARILRLMASKPQLKEGPSWHMLMPASRRAAG